jgi:hypothetical protein
MNKPKPVVTKIEFTKEQLEDIEALHNNKPTKEQIERHAKLKRASDTETWIRNRGHVPRKYIHEVLKKQFYKGLCHKCQAYPTYKVTHDRDGATLVEYWCDKHLPKF